MEIDGSGALIAGGIVGMTLPAARDLAPAENEMRGGETIRLDGALRMPPR